MDRRKQVWYNIYVGRLMKESRPFLIEAILRKEVVA